MVKKPLCKKTIIRNPPLCEIFWNEKERRKKKVFNVLYSYDKDKLTLYNSDIVAIFKF